MKDKKSLIFDVMFDVPDWEIIEQCECDAPTIRTGGETGEYCSIC